MRIALVACTVRGAGSSYTRGVAQALADTGHPVSLWVPDRPPLPVGDPVVTTTFRKPANRGRLAISEAFGLVTRPVYTRSLLAWAPDVVHVVFGEGYPSLFGLQRALRRADVGVAVTMHDPERHPSSIQESAHHLMAYRLARRADGVHVHCQRQVLQLSGNGVRTATLVSAHPAFPCPACGSIAAAPTSEQGDILFFGRFAHYKGLAILGAAAALYYDAGGTRRLVLAGEGRPPAEIDALVKQFPDRVSVDNRYVSDAELHELLVRSAVCVMPYIQGTQSSVPYWARSHGCHLIATDVGCIGDVTRELGGTVVPPGSVSDLTAALLEPADTWSDSATAGFPTFADLAADLLGWYGTLARVS